MDRSRETALLCNRCCESADWREQGTQMACIKSSFTHMMLAMALPNDRAMLDKFSGGRSSSQAAPERGVVGRVWSGSWYANAQSTCWASVGRRSAANSGPLKQRELEAGEPSDVLAASSSEVIWQRTKGKGSPGSDDGWVDCRVGQGWALAGYRISSRVGP